MLFIINDQVEKINKANEAKLRAADEKKAKNLAVVKDKVWEKNSLGTHTYDIPLHRCLSIWGRLRRHRRSWKPA